MPFGKGRRKWLWVLGSLVLGVATIWLSLPIWFPWALRPLAARAGARFSGYHRLGYSRFAVDDVSLVSRSVILHARRLDAFVPSVWLWKLALHQHAQGLPYARSDNWDCQLLPSGNTNPSPPFTQVQDLAATARVLQRWLPVAVLEHGVVRSGETVVVIPEAAWGSGQLQARLQLPRQLPGRSIQARLSPGRPFKLQLSCSALQMESSTQVSTNQAGLDLETSLNWLTNQFQVQAHFSPSDLLPQTASLRESAFQIPGQIAQLPQYSELRGSVLARWERGQFSLDLTAAARPVAAQTNLPPVDLELHARGDTNLASIDKLVLKTPYLDASLSNPVNLSFAAPYLKSDARLNLLVDLSRQKWVPLTGNFNGFAELRPGQGKVPQARLHLAGANIGKDSLKAGTVEVDAQCSWPQVELERADARFDDGSAMALKGKFDLETKTASAGQFHFEGGWPRQYLPEGYSYGQLRVSGTFQGPLDKLEHEGQLEADQVTSPLVQPSTVNARWTGQATALQNFAIRLADTNCALAIGGALSWESNRTEFRLETLSFSTNRSPALDLAKPVTISLLRSEANSSGRWVLDTTPLRWAGPAGEAEIQASVEWPTRGAVQASLKHFPLESFSGLLKSPLPEVEVAQLNASADWATNGPVTLRVDLSASGRVGSPPAGPASGSGRAPGPNAAKTASPLAQSPHAAAALASTPLQIELSLRGDARGILLSNLAINSPTSAVITAQGSLPVTFVPADGTNWLNFDARQSFNLRASVRPEAFFWQELAEMTGLRLEEPEIDLAVSGSWSAPQGHLILGARRVELGHTQFKQLRLEDLRVALNLDRQMARLTQAQVSIQGQRLAADGQLPLNEASWKALEKRELPDWRGASANLRIEQAKLAAFEPLFPELLAPQGQVDLDLKLRPGERLEGTLRVRDARTRPLGNTAPFRDINVTLRFQDRLLSLENASATLSGAEIDLSGRVDLHGTNWLEGGLPPFALTLRGTNVPLAREPDSIVRSDLDLAIAKTNGAPPLVSGAAHLRDSFFLSDLSALVPGGVAKPSSRPPYFSIDTPLLADWRLDTTVDGVRWLKVRTSIFDGEVSANLHLQGTLKDPIVLGGLKIDSGLVRFPFGNLQVQQGLVTLSSQDPYHPQLLVRANSKQFGYDIRMEVTGPVDSPVIQFTSNPSLSSEQILLMITAGQLPQGSYTLSPQQRAQTMALFLGRDLLSKLGLGDQTQERLTIRSGEEISEQGRPTYHVEYRFAQHWFIVGEYDRFGDYNAGFKWRVYSK